MTCALCRWSLHATLDERKTICANTASPHGYALVSKDGTCPKWAGK